MYPYHPAGLKTLVPARAERASVHAKKVHPIGRIRGPASKCPLIHSDRSTTWKAPSRRTKSMAGHHIPSTTLPPFTNITLLPTLTMPLHVILTIEVHTRHRPPIQLDYPRWQTQKVTEIHRRSPANLHPLPHLSSVLPHFAPRPTPSPRPLGHPRRSRRYPPTAVSERDHPIVILSRSLSSKPSALQSETPWRKTAYGGSQTPLA